MPQPFTLKHERSPDFRSGVADGAVVSIVGDQLGARVTITFTRMDARACLQLREERKGIGGGTFAVLVRRGISEFSRMSETSVRGRP